MTVLTKIIYRLKHRCWISLKSWAIRQKCWNTLSHWWSIFSMNILSTKAWCVPLSRNIKQMDIEILQFHVNVNFFFIEQCYSLTFYTSRIYGWTMPISIVGCKSYAKLVYFLDEHRYHSFLSINFGFWTFVYFQMPFTVHTKPFIWPCQKFGYFSFSYFLRDSQVVAVMLMHTIVLQTKYRHNIKRLQFV